MTIENFDSLPVTLPYAYIFIFIQNKNKSTVDSVNKM